MIGLILALGSNLGNCEENLKECLKYLSEYFEIIDHSSLYLSKPVDYLDQNDFYNIVVEYQLLKKRPSEILKITQSIEKKMGRIKKINKGPRNIDIDILFYGSTITKEQNLTIPHPKINERNFVILPLRELKSYYELSHLFNLSLKANPIGIKVLKKLEEFLC